MGLASRAAINIRLVSIRHDRGDRNDRSDMSATTTDAPEPTPAPKRGKLPLVVGVVMALLLGGGGFAAVRLDLLQFGGGHADTAASPLPAIGFIPVDPIVVSLPPGATSRYLRCTVQLEVARGTEAEVTLLLPRVVDVLNGYLRAVDVATLQDPSALVRLRAQMLRRIQVVTGEGRVRDLLVTEFVLN